MQSGQDIQEPETIVSTLEYVYEEDPVLYHLLNDKGEIIIGNNYYRFLPSKLIGIAPTYEEEVVAALSQYDGDFLAPAYNLKVVGYQAKSSELFDYSESGIAQDKNLIDLNYRTTYNDHAFVLENQSFASLTDGSVGDFKWIIDDVELGSGRSITLPVASYTNSTVELAYYKDEVLIKKTPKKKLETRDGNICEHKPFFEKTDECEWTLVIYFENNNPGSYVIFKLPDGRNVRADQFGIGILNTYFAGIVLENPAPICEDGLYSLSFDIYNADGSPVCTIDNREYWSFPCPTCECKEKELDEEQYTFTKNNRNYTVATKLWISDNAFGSSVGSYTRTKGGFSGPDLDLLYCSFEGVIRDKDSCEPEVFPFLAETETNSSYLARNINPATNHPRYTKGVDVITSTHYVIIDGETFDDMRTLRLD